MKRLDSIMDRLEEYLCLIFLSVMSISILIQVINRNIFKMPFPWGEEIARYCMVWATFIGISAGVKAGSHIGVDAVVSKIPDRIRYPFIVIVNIISVVIYIALTVLAVKINMGIQATGQVSPAMQMPMYLAYFGLAAGLFLSSIRAVQITWQRWKECLAYFKKEKGGEAS